MKATRLLKKLLTKGTAPFMRPLIRKTLLRVERWESIIITIWEMCPRGLTEIKAKLKKLKI